MKKLLVVQKIAFTLIILASSLLIWGCQPEGGELLPIGGEGVELTTSRFKNDTVFIKNDNLKIKLYGT